MRDLVEQRALVALRTVAPLRAAARRAVLAALRRWRHGRLLLLLPDGETITVGDAGEADRAELHVHDETLFARVLVGGEAGAGASFVAGEWTSPDLVAVVRLVLRNLDHLEMETPLVRLARTPARVRHLLRRNRRSQSRRNVTEHYDLGNDFYRLFLDETMVYSCAYFERPDATLGEAQVAKLERICRKLDLGAGDRMLDIGGGWGALAIHAASTRGCRVTMTTISPSQRDEARARVAAAGLRGRIEVLSQDYRDLGGRFDKIASIEMLEAVGHEYLAGFFGKCAELLAPDGRLLVQTITMPDRRYERYRREVDWMQENIFPGTCIPAVGALLVEMSRGSDLGVVGLEEIGVHYAPTLQAWRERFEARLDEVRALGFDEELVRKWRLYLAYSEAAFAERTLGDVQVVIMHGSSKSLP